MSNKSSHKNNFIDWYRTAMSEEKSLVLEIIETVITSSVVLLIIYWFVALPEVVMGGSMEPTIYGGERIIVERVTKHFKDFERGDIVVLHPPGNDRIDYVKRVVGIPGDIVKIKDCSVYIARENEKFVLEEPYLYENTCTTEGSSVREGRSLKLDSSEYLVLGDNRPRSADSRTFGVVTNDRIVGRVVLRFWPFSDIELF